MVLVESKDNAIVDTVADINKTASPAVEPQADPNETLEQASKTEGTYLFHLCIQQY